MTIEELKLKLRASGIPPEQCAIGSVPYDGYAILEGNPGWEVFYNDRGSETNYKRFATEQDACEYLIAELRRTGLDIAD